MNFKTNKISIVGIAAFSSERENDRILSFKLILLHNKDELIKPINYNYDSKFEDIIPFKQDAYKITTSVEGEDEDYFIGYELNNVKLDWNEIIKEVLPQMIEHRHEDEELIRIALE